LKNELYQKKPLVVGVSKITEEWFTQDHPNDLHPVGVVIDPVMKTVVVRGKTGHIGDYVVTGYSDADRGEKTIVTPEQLVILYEKLKPSPVNEPIFISMLMDGFKCPNCNVTEDIYQLVDSRLQCRSCGYEWKVT